MLGINCVWKRINQRTYYQVNFDTTDLVKKSIKALDDNLKVTEIRIVVENGTLEEGMTRKTIVEILKGIVHKMTP